MMMESRPNPRDGLELQHLKPRPLRERKNSKYTKAARDGTAGGALDGILAGAPDPLYAEVLQLFKLAVSCWS